MVALAGLATLPLAAGVGCRAVPPARYQEAVNENNELRDRVDALQQTVREANDQIAELEGQLARGGPTATPAGATGAASGEFDGLSGSGVEVFQRGGDTVVSVAGDVLFDSGSATLKSSSRSTLQRIARQIRDSSPGAIVRVEGYTDTDPIRKSKWKSNEHLSAERALAVEAFLVQSGLRNDRVYAAAFGPANPRESKARSRRVEIVVLGG